MGLGVTAILGPNGAGKTSLLSALAGVQPFAGTVNIAGTAVGKRMAEGRVGYLPQRFDLAGGLTANDTVRYAAWCHGVAYREVAEAAKRALTIVELDDKSTSKVRTLSGGERQRLGLACVMSHSPRVLLLDEPTVGLDPEQRVHFRRHLRSIASQTCIVVSTHLLDDVVALADVVVIIADGTIRFRGRPEDLSALADTRSDSATPMESGYQTALARGGEERRGNDE